MSTKIWTAYKLKQSSQLWPFVHHVRLKTTKNVQNVLRKLYTDLQLNVDVKSEAYAVELEKQKNFVKPLSKTESHWRASFEIAHENIKRLYKEASISSQRDFFDFDVSLAFRSWKGGIYVIPHCDMQVRNVLDFLKHDKRLRDYHYQNQTDMSSNITTREWKERERVWNEMDEADCWKDVLVLDICKYDFFWMIDPYIKILEEHRSVK
jgi:hypothetical protein